MVPHIWDEVDRGSTESKRRGPGVVCEQGGKSEGHGCGPFEVALREMLKNTQGNFLGVVNW